MSLSPLSFGQLQVQRCKLQNLRRHPHDVDVLTIKITGSRAERAADMKRFESILNRDPDTGRALPQIGLQLSHDGEHAYFHDENGAQRLSSPELLSLMRQAVNEVQGLSCFARNRLLQGLDNPARKIGMPPERQAYLYKAVFGQESQQEPAALPVSTRWMRLLGRLSGSQTGLAEA